MRKSFFFGMIFPAFVASIGRPFDMGTRWQRSHLWRSLQHSDPSNFGAADLLFIVCTMLEIRQIRAWTFVMQREGIGEAHGSYARA